MAVEEGATIAQVALMVTERVGWPVGVHRVDELKRWLVREGHLEPLPKGDGGEQYAPEVVDRIAGEAWRKRPGWTLRGVAARELFEAYVPAMGEGDGVVRMLLPKRRTWDANAATWTAEVPDRIETYVYPTGEPVGLLVWTGELRDDLPVYARES